jgi:hypothetical protein
MEEIASAAKVDTKPLTDWKKAPTLRELKQDLEDAKPIHDSQVQKIDRWLDNLRVEGKAKPAQVPGRSAIQPKLIRKQAEWRYPALTEPFLSTADIFKVKPVTWEDKKSSQQNQLVLNHQFNTKLDKVSFIDEYVRTAVDEGTVIVFLDWCYETEDYEEEVPEVQFVVNPEYAEIHEYLAHLKKESPSEYLATIPEELREAHDLAVEEGRPIEPEIIGKKMATKTRVVKNHPLPEVCDYRNTVIDPTCGGDISQAGFVIRSYESSKALLNKYPNRYKNLDQIQVENNTILGSPDHSVKGENQTFNFSDEARKKFIVYQYWGLRDLDGKGKLTPFVAEWVGDVMIRLEKAPVPAAGLPFVLEQYLPVRKNNYGEPDGELLEDNQKVLGALMRGMIDIMARSANGQTGISKAMLDATNRRKFEQGKDYEFNPGVDPRMGVYMHTYPEIPASAQFMTQMVQMEAESLTGVKAWNQGIGSQGLGDVAAGIRGALDASSKRELNILRRLSNGLVKLARKMIAMNAELLSDEEVIRITNEEFVTVKRDDLPGNFDLELAISTAEEDNNKAEQLAFMLQTVGPNTDPSMVRMILAEICRLRKMPDLAHAIENYQPQQDPVAQKMQELAVAELETKIAKARAETQLILENANLSAAKAVTEGAKQGHLKAATDKTNLDFIEQESGVKQERDKELQGEQARAQGQLAVTQHHLDTQREAIGHQKDLLKTYMTLRAQKIKKN